MKLIDGSQLLQLSRKDLQKKGSFKQSFLQKENIIQKNCPINRGRTREKTFAIKKMKEKVLERKLYMEADVAVNLQKLGSNNKKREFCKRIEKTFLR